MDEVALKELMSYPLVEFAKGEHLLSYDDEASYVYYLVEGNPVILHKEVIEDKNTEHDPFAEF